MSESERRERQISRAVAEADEDLASTPVVRLGLRERQTAKDEKPIVYLDVDGVLLAFREPVQGMRWGWSDWVDYEGSGLVYSPGMVAGLNALADRAEFFWLTTWDLRAPNVLAPDIGLTAGSTWPVLGRDFHRGRPGRFDWWKLNAVDEHHRGRRCVWVDDDIHDDHEARDWLHTRPNVRWLSPECWSGLRPGQLQMLLAWIGSDVVGEEFG